jgi:hypothetical protein
MGSLNQGQFKITSIGRLSIYTYSINPKNLTCWGKTTPAALH